MHHGDDMNAWHYFTGPHVLWWGVGIAIIGFVIYAIIKMNSNKKEGE